MSLSDRIKQRMRTLQMSAADLSRAVGVKPSSMSLWLNGTTKSIKGANLLRAAKALGVDAEWLATGRAGPSNVVQETAVEYVIRQSQDPDIEEAVILLEDMSQADRREAVSFLRVFATKKGASRAPNSSDSALSRAKKKAA